MTLSRENILYQKPWWKYYLLHLAKGFSFQNHLNSDMKNGAGPFFPLCPGHFFFFFYRIQIQECVLLQRDGSQRNMSTAHQ